MCLAIPGEIEQLVEDERGLAWVNVSGVRRIVNVSLLENEGVTVGDWVLIHVGFALSKIDEEEARLTLELLEGLGRAYEDELEALAESQIT